MMSKEERLIWMSHIKERKEAVEEFLDWIEWQKSLCVRRIADLDWQKNQALGIMRDIIQEETRWRDE